MLYSTLYHVNIYYNYGANVYARCTARHSVPEACGIELDQSQCVINSINGELGGEKGSRKGNGDGTDKGVGDNKNVRSADGNNGNVGVVGVVCGNDRFRDGGRGGHYGDVDYGCGERGGFGGGCGAGGCRGGGACGGGGGCCGGGGGEEVVVDVVVIEMVNNFKVVIASVQERFRACLYKTTATAYSCFA